MKFFYINNSLCEGCDGCSVVCPAGAIYVRAGKRYIEHGKCTSCGACIRNCGHEAVSLEGVDGMVQRMENADLYLSRIRRLEKELAQANGRLEEALDDIAVILESSPSATAVCTAAGTVEACNSGFTALLERCGRGAGNSLGALLPDGADTLVLRGTGGETALNFEQGGRSFCVRSHKLSRGCVLCVFDDLTDGRVISARVARSLRRAVDRKMEMVRRIGTILGDEASSTLNDINAALDLLENDPAAAGPDSLDPGGEGDPENL